MPYARPDRKGLRPLPPPEGDRDSELRRSDSYLRLSELGGDPSNVNANDASEGNAIDKTPGNGDAPAPEDSPQHYYTPPEEESEDVALMMKSGSKNVSVTPPLTATPSEAFHTAQEGPPSRPDSFHSASMDQEVDHLAGEMDGKKVADTAKVPTSPAKPSSTNPNPTSESPSVLSSQYPPSAPRSPPMATRRTSADKQTEPHRTQPQSKIVDASASGSRSTPTGSSQQPSSSGDKSFDPARTGPGTYSQADPNRPPAGRSNTTQSRRRSRLEDSPGGLDAVPETGISPTMPSPAVLAGSRRNTSTRSPRSLTEPVVPPTSWSNKTPLQRTKSGRDEGESPRLTMSRRTTRATIPTLDLGRGTTEQSVAANMAFRHGDVLQRVCYGPVQLADLEEAYNISNQQRIILDAGLLKRLDDAIFFRDDDADSVRDTTIQSFIVTAETRLLYMVQQFMITAALLPFRKRMFEGDSEPDPLEKFVGDAEALVQYVIEDLTQQADVFMPSATSLMGFIQQRCDLAHTSAATSFYFRHELTDMTTKYVQGLCETICALWPNGKFYIGTEDLNPRDSMTPIHFHRPTTDTSFLIAREFDKYFTDPGLLGHVTASDYRQLFRGAFPFLMDLGREVPPRPDRERDMCVDAWYIEKGVLRFERTTFVREHLLVDSNRRVRIYVDAFDGTKYLVYFNHRIARSLGLAHMGFEILQSYNSLFLSNWRSREIAVRLGINIASLELFSSIFLHRQIFDAPHVNEFLLFRGRLIALQRRLATFRPERFTDVFKGGYAEPIVQGVVWFMITLVLLVLGSIIATIVVNVVTR